MARAEALEARVLRGSIVRRRCSHASGQQPSLSDRTFEVFVNCAGYFAAKSWRWPTRGRSCCTTSRRCGPTRSSSPKRLDVLPIFGHKACKHDVACVDVPEVHLHFWYTSRTFINPGAGRTDHVPDGHVGHAVVIVVLMACTALLSAYGVDFGPGFGPGAATSTAPFVRFAGLGRLLPATVFAQNMGGQVPLWWRGRCETATT